METVRRRQQLTFHSIPEKSGRNLGSAPSQRAASWPITQYFTSSASRSSHTHTQRQTNPPLRRGGTVRYRPRHPSNEAVGARGVHNGTTNPHPFRSPSPNILHSALALVPCRQIASWGRPITIGRAPRISPINANAIGSIRVQSEGGGGGRCGGRSARWSCCGAPPWGHPVACRARNDFLAAIAQDATCLLHQPVLPVFKLIGSRYWIGFFTRRDLPRVCGPPPCGIVKSGDHDRIVYAGLLAYEIKTP